MQLIQLKIYIQSNHVNNQHKLRYTSVSRWLDISNSNWHCGTAPQDRIPGNRYIGLPIAHCNSSQLVYLEVSIVMGVPLSRWLVYFMENPDPNG